MRTRRWLGTMRLLSSAVVVGLLCLLLAEGTSEGRPPGAPLPWIPWWAVLVALALFLADSVRDLVRAWHAWRADRGYSRGG
ncbi:hypothetical protein [Streptomyces bikiniensis]|uniref:hypothetical protein n=1 Tax=Streptomyces bikiniensis TaxID=1896 RepID=UPI00131A5382|nr:hypothetical protein [Streptomyces bikiniensis]